MRYVRAALAAVCLAALAGCVTPPQTPVALAKDALDPASGSLAVAMPYIAKPAVDFSSAGCLLCLMAASAANSELSKHADKLTYEDLSKLRNELVAALRKKGVNATPTDNVVDVRGLPAYKTEAANVARQDFTGFRSKVQADKLLVVSITSLGFVRAYSAYFPVGAPQATLKGAVFIVNLKNNSYEYYQPLSFLKASDGAWDEPPAFPGLTNAYYQVIELGRDAILKPLARP
jgi:hypothetical protein